MNASLCSLPHVLSELLVYFTPLRVALDAIHDSILRVLENKRHLGNQMVFVYLEHVSNPYFEQESGIDMTGEAAHQQQIFHQVRASCSLLDVIENLVDVSEMKCSKYSATGVYEELGRIHHLEVFILAPRAVTS
jgi:hypothetical protein